MLTLKIFSIAQRSIPILWSFVRRSYHQVIPENELTASNIPKSYIALSLSFFGQSLMTEDRDHKSQRNHAVYYLLSPRSVCSHMAAPVCLPVAAVKGVRSVS